LIKLLVRIHQNGLPTPSYWVFVKPMCGLLASFLDRIQGPSFARLETLGMCLQTAFRLRFKRPPLRRGKNCGDVAQPRSLSLRVNRTPLLDLLDPPHGHAVEADDFGAARGRSVLVQVVDCVNKKKPTSQKRSGFDVYFLGKLGSKRNIVVHVIKPR